jgi:protein arginine kinase activator
MLGDGVEPPSGKLPDSPLPNRRCQPMIPCDSLSTPNSGNNSMKKCRRCTKTATLHITEIRDGKAVAVHLCETCAREYLEKSAETPEEVLQDLAAKFGELISSAAHSVASCPECGITFNEFRESGRFGCAHDYSEFLEELIPLLENIHEDTTHTGKRPRHALMGTQDQARLVHLRNSLRAAVEAEDYESAALLRDQIAALEADVRRPATQSPPPTPPQH